MGNGTIGYRPSAIGNRQGTVTDPRIPLVGVPWIVQ
jgi:hypothetical protein